jgi:hypothetical protein
LCCCKPEDDSLSTSYLQENQDTNLELILNPSAEYRVFDLVTLRNATNNFSDKNKLGQGGFGPVYKVNTEPHVNNRIFTFN